MIVIFQNKSLVADLIVNVIIIYILDDNSTRINPPFLLQRVFGLQTQTNESMDQMMGGTKTKALEFLES